MHCFLKCTVVYWHLYRIQHVRHKLSYFKQLTWKLLEKVLPNQMQQVLSTKRTIQILQQTHCGLLFFLMYETYSVVIANSNTVVQRQNIITTPILKFFILYLLWIWALFEPNPGKHLISEIPYFWSHYYKLVYIYIYFIFLSFFPQCSEYSIRKTRIQRRSILKVL